MAVWQRQFGGGGGGGVEDHRSSPASLHTCYQNLQCLKIGCSGPTRACGRPNPARRARSLDTVSFPTLCFAAHLLPHAFVIASSLSDQAA